MEQARGIKEKRELAKELGEYLGPSCHVRAHSRTNDYAFRAEVQSFEQETNKIYARKRSRSTATKDESEPQSEEERT